MPSPSPCGTATVPSTSASGSATLTLVSRSRNGLRNVMHSKVTKFGIAAARWRLAAAHTAPEAPTCGA